MSSTTPTVGKRKPKSEATADSAPAEKTSSTIRVDPDLSRMATIIAIRRGISVADLISPMLRPALMRLYREAVLDMAKEVDPPG